MSFKKKKLKTQWPQKTAYSVGIISIISIFLFGIFLINNISAVSFNITDSIVNIVQENNDDVKTIHSKEKINILVTGRWGWDHDAPNLTDTIMLVSIHTIHNTVSMLSIPRDLYVEYQNGGSGRINEVYRNNLAKTQSVSQAMWILKNKVSEITGEQIDYYVTLDFEGFIEIVDIFDGIEITLEENFIDTTYPDGNGGHVTFLLKQGTWTLDGDTALKYARSRHSTSDFDRSLRQQTIIHSLKNKIIENWFLKNTTKIRDLYRVFNKYVDTDISMTQVLALATLAKQDYHIISSNINDSCFYGSQNCEKWWFLYVPERELFWGASILLIEWSQQWNLSDYSAIQPYFNNIFNDTNIFKENIIINVFNWTGQNFLASTMADSIKKYGFAIPAYNSIWNADEIYETSIIYYNGISENSSTLGALKQLISAPFEQSSFPKISDTPVSIEIVIGNDYQSVFNF